MKLEKIINYLDEIAPPELAFSWDNPGLLIGRFGDDIKTIMFCLDVTGGAIREAVEKGVDLIVSHHPVIFEPIKNITDAALLTLIKNDIAVFSAHTNLDVSLLNDVLFDKLGLINNINNNKEDLLNGLGRVGELAKPTPFLEFAEDVKRKLNVNLRYSGERNVVRRVAVAGGACGTAEFIRAAREKNCDALVTGDVKHHDAIFAAEIGLNIIDATHHATEVVIIEELIKIFENFDVKTSAYTKGVFGWL